MDRVSSREPAPYLQLEAAGPTVKSIGVPVRKSDHGMPSLSDALAEFAGTSILLALGLSAATLILSSSSPLYRWIADVELRRFIAGVCFVSVAAGVIYSPLGKRSGGHLNPAITIGFFRLGKISGRGAIAYVTCQLAGAITGAAIVRLLWGNWTRRIHLAASAPGRLGSAWAFIAEVVGTSLLAFVVFNFVDRPRLIRFTPFAAASTIVACVLVEYPASTTSLNPARSLGPAVLTARYATLWVYLLAPPIGAILAAAAFSHFRGEIACGKLVHDDGYECRFRNCRYRK